MNRLVILEDDLNFSRKLFNYIMNQNRQLQLLNMSLDGTELFDIIDEIDENDIILLDLGLPKINGIDLIKYFKDRKTRIPYIIVMSGNTEMIRGLKEYTDCICAVIEKPFQFEEITKIVDQISHYSDRGKLERIIYTELSKFEFNIATIGYTYIVDAVSLAMQDENLLRNLKSNLYERIARKYNNTSIVNVKWAIEKSIQTMTRYTPKAKIQQYFHLGKSDKLTPKLFLATVIANLRIKYEEAV